MIDVLFSNDWLIGDPNWRTWRWWQVVSTPSPDFWAGHHFTGLQHAITWYTPGSNWCWKTSILYADHFWSIYLSIYLSIYVDLGICGADDTGAQPASQGSLNMIQFLQDGLGGLPWVHCLGFERPLAGIEAPQLFLHKPLLARSAPASSRPMWMWMQVCAIQDMNVKTQKCLKSLNLNVASVGVVCVSYHLIRTKQ